MRGGEQEMTRIATFAMLVAVAVLALAVPSQAQLAGELRVTDRITTVSPAPVGAASGSVLTPSSGLDRPGWYRGIEDRGVR